MLITTSGDIIQDKLFGKQTGFSNVNKQAVLAVCALGECGGGEALIY